MSELCRNCGHHLPNAVGPGLYCNHCGEPKDKPEPAPERKPSYEEFVAENPKGTAGRV